jgi:hypothetical protein
VIEIRKIEDIEPLTVPPPLKNLIRSLLERFVAAIEAAGGAWDPDADGSMILLEGADATADLLQIASADALDGVFLEGVNHHEAEGAFVCALVPGGDYGLTLIVADSPEIGTELRAWLMSQAGPGEAEMLEDAS